MTSPRLTLALLRERDRATYDLLLEAVGNRAALAAVLVAQVGDHAAALALEDERNRVRAHLKVAEAIGPSGWPVAAEAIRSGERLEAAEPRYQQAADARRSTRLALVAGAPKEGA